VPVNYQCPKIFYQVSWSFLLQPMGDEDDGGQFFEIVYPEPIKMA
jgi:hypothetical protein